MRRYGILSAGFLALALATGCARKKPRYNGIDVTGAAIGPDFRLLDPEGKWRSLSEFRGQYVMLFFGFTQCPDVCPTSLARAAVVRNKLDAEGIRVQVVFVTVDPERDTPQLLREYTKAFDPSFLGLRGDPTLTRETAAAFRIAYEKVPTGKSYTMNHTALTYIFDKQGRPRLAMGHNQTPEQYADDIRTLDRSGS